MKTLIILIKEGNGCKNIVKRTSNSIHINLIQFNSSYYPYTASHKHSINKVTLVSGQIKITEITINVLQSVTLINFSKFTVFSRNLPNLLSSFVSLTVSNI